MKSYTNLPVRLQRLAHRLWRARVPVVPWAIQQVMRFGLGCFIPYRCEISGENVHFGHNGMGVCVDYRVRIGHDVRIDQHVTLGDRTGEGGPQVGNHVRIGAGAQVLGRIRIGDHVNIGAGAIVIEDVPDWTTVVGPKAVQKPRARSEVA